MNRIDKKFKELKKAKKKALIVYITAGDPSLAVTEKLVPELEKAGADIIELGIPFSDPLADGPTIQAASHRALKNKVNLTKIFNLVKALRKKTAIPMVLMGYYNPIRQYGLERFSRDCRNAGVDGVIVPDLPCEEAQGLMKFAKKYKVSGIFLAAPTSTRERLKEITKNSAGFIYYVSLTGTTGARSKLPTEITSKVRVIKSMTKKPVCVGFGISTPQQAKQIAKISDGVIIGSAVVKIIAGKKDLIKKVPNFVRRLAAAIHNV